jgi:hypothetical protein
LCLGYLPFSSLQFPVLTVVAVVVNFAIRGAKLIISLEEPIVNSYKICPSIGVVGNS